MAIRINTNVAAMDALRNVNNTADQFGRSINRLSTGLRITTAADDPAGLIISENFRAQIAGISQAVSNSQTAVNLVKTSEGALDEIQSLLKNARGIAVQAANSGVNDSSALEADQTQIRSTIESINRIAEQTQFGNKKLLDGTAGVQAQVSDTSDVGALQFTGTFSNGTTTSPISNGNVSAALVTNSSKATVTGTTTYGSTASIVARGSVIINGVSISTDGTESLQAFINKLNAQTSATGVVAKTVTSTTGSVSVSLEQQTYGSHFSVVSNDNNSLIGTSGSSTGRDAVFTISVTSGSTVLSTNFTGGRNSADNGLKLTDSNGNVVLLTEKGNATLTTTAAQIGNISVGSVNFQVGANSGQSAVVSISDAHANKLGTTAIAGKTFADIDLTTSQGAQDAIQIIDAAITQIAKNRGDLGSFQRNVLESNIRSLNVAKENLTATESSIRDVDQAEEITNYTKLQILNQSGIAVLAQANQSPASVLGLLK